jgi:site-specific recombinase XerD
MHGTLIALANYRSAVQQSRATSTTNVHVAALRTWCYWLTEQGYLEENPSQHLKSVGRVDRDAPEPISNNAVNALLRAARRGRNGKRNHAILQMLLQTGMRLGECQALQWQDISLQVRKGIVFIRSGKGNKARTIPLNSSARLALVEYAAPLLECEASARAVTAHWPRQTGNGPITPFWHSQKGRQLSATAMWRVFKGVVDDCAHRDLVPAETTPHDLRHSFAHRYLEKHPGDLVGLARILGHKSLDTTKIYTQPTVEQLAHRISQIPLNAYG